MSKRCAIQFQTFHCITNNNLINIVIFHNFNLQIRVDAFFIHAIKKYATDVALQLIDFNRHPFYEWL